MVLRVLAKPWFLQYFRYYFFHGLYRMGSPPASRERRCALQVLPRAVTWAVYSAFLIEASKHALRRPLGTRSQDRSPSRLGTLFIHFQAENRPQEPLREGGGGCGGNTTQEPSCSLAIAAPTR